MATKKMSTSGIMTAIIFVLAVVGILLAKNHQPVPEITLESILIKYQYLCAVAALLFLVGWYWFSRLFFLSLIATVFSFLFVTGVFFYLNQHLDTAETLDYLVVEKFERTLRYNSDTAKSKSSSYYTDLCLKAVHQNSGRISVFSVAQGDFYQPVYQNVDLATKTYWVHVIEGNGKFDLRWRKEVIGVFEHPLKN